VLQESTELRRVQSTSRRDGVVYVDPRGTSKTSPNGKPLAFINYGFVKLGDATTTRDTIASWNLALRGLRQMRGSRVTWSPDSSVNAGMRTRPNTENPGVIPRETPDSPRSKAMTPRAKRGNPRGVFTSIHK